MVRVSVPGKVHLIGEHAVVYGEPAILAAVDMRTFVEAEKADEVSFNHFTDTEHFDTFSVEEILEAGRKAEELWKEGFEKKDFSHIFSFVKGNDFRKAGIGIILDRLGIDSGVKVQVDSKLPMGSGLGSSSSISVALVKAIAEAHGKSLSKEEVNNLAYELEKLKHGTPSGGDNTACCFGGLVWFQKASPKNIIQPLEKEISHKLENFVLVYTKAPEKTTGELVSLVRNLEENFKDQRVKHIGKMAHEMREILKHKNYSRMKEIINETHKNLSELGVSIPEMEQIASEVRNIGGAAKLCGAGGGGTMLCWHEDKQKLANLIKDLGYTPWETELAVEGVTVL
ncbi:MAG: mevalonate kinase [Candidatus Aenigmarchaeota archaeon]|nr:mevalonate kinase [Candidatus Aenigmarchaeota archaeon]